MNQELMTLDFWQDTVIYEGKTFPNSACSDDNSGISSAGVADSLHDV